MKIDFATGQLMDRIGGDQEFRLGARHWTGTLALGIGDSLYSLSLADGNLVGVSRSVRDDLTDPQGVRVTAPEEDWVLFLRQPAPPFYLDFSSASRHHNFEISGDVECFWAYFPAIRRVGDLLREVANSSNSKG